MNIAELEKFHNFLEKCKKESTIEISAKITNLQNEIRNQIGYLYVYGGRDDL